MCKILAFIPARKGSKEIKNKNIKKFNGKPLIEWTIKSALLCKLISNVVVSTDCPKISRISKRLGVNVVKRPKRISGDKASVESAIKHYLMKSSSSFKTIVLLSPTSPLRKSSDIENALKEFKSKKLDSCFSVSALTDFLIWKKNNKTKKLVSINYNFKNRGTRQDRDQNYLENGSIYIFKTKIFKQKNNRISGKIGMYFMDFWQSLELDRKKDWKLLETIQKIYINEL